MKLIAIFLGLMLSFSLCYSQLINPDFEEWDGNDPVGWYNHNFAYEAVEPSEDAFSGNFAAYLMITEVTMVSPLFQTITTVEVEDMVTFEVHYAALTEGSEVTFGAIAYRNGQVVDGCGSTIEEVNQPYQQWSAEWEPMFDSYDSLRIMLALDLVDEPVAGSVLIDNVVINGVSTQGVEDKLVGSAVSWQLDAAYPNPFNAATTIGFTAPLAGLVELAVYDLAGRRVTTLVSGIYAPGSYRVMWDGTGDSGRGLGSGVYIVQLTANGHSYQTQAVLIK